MGKKAVLIINNATGNVTISAAGVPNTYSITSKITNGTLSGATTIQYDSGATVTVLPNTGYNLPSSVSVTGATLSSYASSTGKLVLTNCTGNVAVTGTCVVKTFTVTTTVKNGTSSGSTSITYGGSGSVTVTPGSDYKLPSSITVTGASYTYSTTTGVISLSNATGNVVINVVCEEKPKYVKGSIIQMSLGNATPAAGTNNQYRVLKVDGTVVEVVAMYDISTSQVFSSSNNTYSGSSLDTYLNTTWYGTLSSTAKAAIVANNINQYQYPSGSITDTHRSYATYGSKSLKATVGSRYIYALDVEDIEMYFGGTGGSASANTPGTFSAADLWTLFWDTTSKPSNYTYPWLRSALSSYSDLVFFVYGRSGCVNHSYYNYDYAARPAFKIDLSKISYTVIK